MIYWIMEYFFLRYRYLQQDHRAGLLRLKVLVGVLAVGAFLTFAPTVVIPRLIHRRKRAGA